MIAGILLAAGRSVRFGQDKLLYPLDDGTPLGVRSARHLSAAISRCYAVVADRDARLGSLFVEEGVTVVPCGNAEQGMGASIACGVAAAGDADGYVIALADMPFVAPATIRLVADALEQGALCAAPTYRGQRGHPVGFARAMRGELLALDGERGARAVFARAASQARFLEVDDPGILRDVDRLGDLRSAGLG